jgi:hypothetical protein
VADRVPVLSRTANTKAAAGGLNRCGPRIAKKARVKSKVKYAVSPGDKILL